MFYNDRNFSFDHEATKIQKETVFQENNFGQEDNHHSLFDLDFVKLNLKEDREEEFMHPVSQRTTDDLSQFIGFFHESEELGFED